MGKLASRPSAVALLIVLATALAACGGGESARKSPPGSPDNPIVSGAVDDGSDPDVPGRPRPGYRDLVKNQARRADVRDSPCALVSKRQAQAILGGNLLDPYEASQGPTCIYRSRSGDAFVTVAVQAQDFARLRRDLRRLRSVQVSDRTAYCGVHGAPMLYLPVARGRVLSVTGQCEVAMRFARRAVPRLAP